MLMHFLTHINFCYVVNTTSYHQKIFLILNLHFLMLVSYFLSWLLQIFLHKKKLLMLLSYFLIRLLHIHIFLHNLIYLHSGQNS